MSGVGEKKLTFALEQIYKTSWVNLSLVTSDSNVMLGKCFFHEHDVVNKRVLLALYFQIILVLS